MDGAPHKPSALDYANHLIWLAEQHRKYLDPLQLQKLLYYAQGWALETLGYPLFEDEIRAWRKGPVVHSVWNHFKGKNKIKLDNHKLCELSPSECDLLHSVLERYGHMTGGELSVETHKADGPWDRARAGLPEHAYSREPIKIDEIRRAFHEEAANSDQAFSDAWDGLLEMAKINTDLLSNRGTRP